MNGYLLLANLEVSSHASIARESISDSMGDKWGVIDSLSTRKFNFGYVNFADTVWRSLFPVLFFLISLLS